MLSIIMISGIPIIIVIVVFCYIKHIKNSQAYIDFNAQFIHNDWSFNHTGESITLKELNKILLRVLFSDKESLNKDIKQVLEILYNKHQDNITTLSLNKINNATQLSSRPLNVNRVRIAINFLVKHNVIETHRDHLETNSYIFYLTKLHPFL